MLFYFLLGDPLTNHVPVSLIRVSLKLSRRAICLRWRGLGQRDNYNMEERGWRARSPWHDEQTREFHKRAVERTSARQGLRYSGHTHISPSYINSPEGSHLQLSLPDSTRTEAHCCPLIEEWWLRCYESQRVKSQIIQSNHGLAEMRFWLEMQCPGNYCVKWSYKIMNSSQRNQHKKWFKI